MSAVDIRIRYPRGIVASPARRLTVIKNLVRLLRSHAPEKTGRLRRSIRRKGLNLIRIGVPYASYANGYTGFIETALNAFVSRFYRITYVQVGYNRYNVTVHRRFRR